MKKIGLISFLALFLGLSFLLTNIAWGSDSNALFVPDELLVQPKAGVQEEKIREIFRGVGATVVGEIPRIRVKHIKVPAHAIEKVKAALSRNPHVNYAEYNFLAEPLAIPNDSYYSSQWHHPKIYAPQGWDINKGSTTVPIAIIDTGVDPAHPDISAKLLPGYNFYDNNTDTRDVHGHGTAVAGSAAAISNNGTGVAGVAWNNPIMPLRISSPDGWATYSAMASAIIYAADRGVRIINISFGGTSSSSTLQNAVNYAWNKGAIVFASAGNSSTDTLTYPAACSNAIAVSATTSSDTLATFSNYGNWIDISAPGVSILSTNNGGGYGWWSGTSFSSPIAAGLAGLVVSANPFLSNLQIENIIKQNADDLGASGFDPSFGYGRINAYKSLLAAANSNPQPDTEAPVVSITSPADGSTVSGGVTVSISASDNVGVSRVDLYVNGAFYASDSTGPYSFYLDTTQWLDGVYYLDAVAYDAAGNAGRSNSVMIYVNNPKDTIAPSVSITSPKDGSYVSSNQKISVTASDNVGVIRIELYIDGVLRSSVSGSSLSFTWNTRKVAKGAHIISTKAYDAAGNVGTTSITVYK